MARDYTAIPHEYLDEMEELTDEEFGRLMRILLLYSQTGEEVSPVGNERFFVRRVKNREDRYQESFDDLSEVRSEAGKKGAHSRWNSKNMANDSKNGKAISANGKNGYTDSDTDTNTNSNNITPQSPQKGDGFERFWDAYPKKVGKQAAFKAFQRIKGVSVETMITAVEYQRSTDAWKKNNGQFIPNPATWLNQGRWEDDVSAMSAEPSGPKRKAQPCPADYGMEGTTVDRGDIDWLIEEMRGTG